VTITSQPKFLGLIGYQISLAMELRWRPLPAGSAKNNKEKRKKKMRKEIKREQESVT